MGDRYYLRRMDRGEIRVIDGHGRALDGAPCLARGAPTFYALDEARRYLVTINARDVLRELEAGA